MKECRIKIHYSVLWAAWENDISNLKVSIAPYNPQFLLSAFEDDPVMVSKVLALHISGI